MPTIAARATRSPAESTTNAPDSSGHDYDAADTLVVTDREQMRALADEVRSAIVARLRDRARSTQQLSEDLAIPKGTVGHHLKVLERAGLVRVVRTRQVRAITEKFYGRTARLFLFHAENPEDERALAATMLRQAAAEIDRAPEGATFGHTKARLRPADATRLERRLKRLMVDMRGADTRQGTPWALAAALYERRDA